MRLPGGPLLFFARVSAFLFQAFWLPLFSFSRFAQVHRAPSFRRQGLPPSHLWPLDLPYPSSTITIFPLLEAISSNPFPEVFWLLRAASSSSGVYHFLPIGL